MNWGSRGPTWRRPEPSVLFQQGGASDSVRPWLPAAANQRRVPALFAFDARVEGAEIESVSCLLTSRADGFLE